MKKAAVAVLGTVLLALGVALLVLPGPGFLLIAAALALLSTQFAWAKVPLDYARTKAQDGIAQVSRSRLRAGGTIACAVALIAVGVVELTGVDIRYVNSITAVMLIGSGAVLLGTIGYALLSARREPLPAAARRPS